MTKNNRLGDAPIPTLILKLAIPVMLSMALQALYNVIDSIYIARLGDLPLTAVSLAYPIERGINAIANGIGIGASSLIARLLGGNKPKEANESGNTGCLFSLLVGLVFLCTGKTITSMYVRFFTDEPELAHLAKGYIGICTSFCIFQITGTVICFMIQGTGETLQTLLCLAVGVILNIILDPLLMFSCGMGINGAAWASVIGQAVSLVIAYLLLRKNDRLSCFKQGEKLWKRTLLFQLLSVGIPTMLLQMSGCVSLSLVNKILITFTPIAVTVFGLYIKVEGFFFLPMHGLCNSLLPVTAFNYGAQNRRRIEAGLKTSLLYCYAFMAVGMVIFQTKPEALVSIFNPSPEVLEMSRFAFRRVNLCFIGAPMIYLTASFLQGFGKGTQAAMITLLRQFCGVLPSAWVLARIIGLDGVWYCYFFGDCVGVTVSAILLRGLFRSVIKKMAYKA